MEEKFSFREAREAFFARCRLLNLSPHTLAWYDGRLKAMLEYLLTHYPDVTPQTVTLNQLREVVQHVSEVASVATTNHTITAIKAMMNYLYDEGYIDSNPAYKLKKMREPKTLIQTFTDEQIKALLAACNKRKFAGIRDYTIYTLILDTGLRISEALGLKVEDINWTQNTAKVMGKGSRERVVPFGRSARSALTQYMERRGEVNDCNLVFVNEYAEPIGVRAFENNMKRVGRTAAITGVRVSPHTCRHTFAVSWIRNGGDVFHLQRILGHSSLEICRRYVNLATEDLQRAHQNHSPIDRMLGDPRSSRPKRKKLR